MRHPEFPIVSFLSLPLLLSPLPSHIRARSVSTLALIAWMSVMSIIRGVNTLVWADNTIIRLEVWCDITTKITIGFTYGVPAAALCIMRHLEHVASTRHVLTTKDDKRRRQCIEGFMCFGIPVLFMGLHYIVQGHRFDLVEDLGCSPAQYISAAAVVILWVPPLTISLATMIYAGLVLRHFLRHRISFATHLQNTQSSISPSRYLRLMALAVVTTAWDSGTNIYLLYFNVSLSGLRPYISWDNVHSNFSRVAVFPRVFFPPWLLNQFIIQWWIIPVSCLVFFVFLGMGEEAVSDYRAAWTWCRRVVLRQGIKPSRSYQVSLPIHRPPTQPDVEVSLPGHDTFDQHSKEWDALSLKLPDIKEHASLPPGTESIGSIDTLSGRHVFDVTRRPPLDYPASVKDNARESYLETASHSSSFELSNSQTHNDSPAEAPPTLTVIVTNADSGSHPHSENALPPPARIPSPSLPVTTRSSVSFQNSNHRRSVSSDPEITISEAYFPDDETPPQYPAPRQNTMGRYIYPHGGIHMTVERTME